MGQVRTAVIGYGNMGTAHAACLAEGRIEGLRLAAVCDIDPARLAAAHERHPEAACFENVEALLESGCAEAVIVAVPHPMHAEVASKALRRGLHALVEKPIDISVSKAKALCEAARESGRVFAVMLNQRTHPIYQRAREIVRGGELGELKRTTWIITNWYRTQHYYDSGAWRATWAGEGGGVLLNQAPHNLDLWQWICGMPSEVTAWCRRARYHRIEVEDDALLLTRYDNGAMGQFITTTGEYPGTNRLEIAGDLGKIVLEGGALKWWKLREPENEFRFRSGEDFAHIPHDVIEFAPEDTGKAHAGILQNFANAILHGEALLSPGEDGLPELTLSNAAYLSEWQGNAPISLPFDEALFDRLLRERAADSVYKEGRREARTNSQYSERWQVNW